MSPNFLRKKTQGNLLSAFPWAEERALEKKEKKHNFEKPKPKAFFGLRECLAFTQPIDRELMDC